MFLKGHSPSLKFPLPPSWLALKAEEELQTNSEQFWLAGLLSEKYE